MPHISYDPGDKELEKPNGTTLFQPSGADKAAQLQMQLVSLLSPRAEDFGIRGEHSLLRERVDNSLAIPDA